MAELYNTLVVLLGLDFTHHPPLVSVTVLPLMDSTNVIADVVPPLRPAGGSARRPLSRIATQPGIRPTMDLTESPESELPPRELPQVSLRPPPSYSPPVNSGLRRQSIRRGTHEAPPSTLEERVPPRPPSIPTAAVPHPSGPIPPTPDPTGPQRLVPDDGVTRCPPTRPPRHGSSRDYSTGDYPYRFDTMPSPCSDSGPPYYKSTDISGGVHATVWPTLTKYLKNLTKRGWRSGTLI